MEEIIASKGRNRLCRKINFKSAFCYIDQAGLLYTRVLFSNLGSVNGVIIPV